MTPFPPPQTSGPQKRRDSQFQKYKLHGPEQSWLKFNHKVGLNDCQVILWIYNHAKNVNNFQVGSKPASNLPFLSRVSVFTSIWRTLFSFLAKGVVHCCTTSVQGWEGPQNAAGRLLRRKRRQTCCAPTSENRNLNTENCSTRSA